MAQRFYGNYETEDTICALATAHGTGALAIVRISGGKAFEIVSQLIHEPLPSNCGGRHFLRRVKVAEGQEVEAVVICFKAPKSFTGEDVVEISLPGNMLVAEKLIGQMKSLGARMAEPGEFSFRAYLNGKMDLPQAEGVNETIRAGSEEILRLALNQLGGELSERVRKWLDALNKVLARIEVVHDYPGGVADASVDEVEVFGGATSEAEFVKEKLTPIIQELKSAIDFYNRYSRLRDGLKVVILGAPNVGKSTLFNRLVGFERAIVTELPGTTRDYLEESLSIGGVKVSLVDTAGLRDAENLVEMLGIVRTRKLISEADAVIVMEDIAHFYPDSETPLPRVGNLISRLKLEGRPYLLVLNKADTIGKPPPGEVEPLLRPIPVAARMRYSLFADEVGGVLVSATTGYGLETVLEFLQGLTSIKDTSVRFLLTDRQKRLTEIALDALNRAVEAVERRVPLDVASIDLYEAQRALSAILSLESRDMVLEEIFANFCVGK